MPNRNKRKIEDFDPNKSDSADSTYGASTIRAARSKPSRNHRGKPSRKRQRRLHSEEGSEDITDESEVSEPSDEEGVKDEEPELDSRTGRPVRKAAKKRPLYEEDSDESIEEAPDSEAEKEVTSKKQGNRRLLVKLKVPTPQQTPAPVRRNTRARSGSVGARRISSETQPSGTRRSSRIAHDESETIVALTNSGHHADIIRPGTRTPELEIQRARKGGKGLKKLPASVVFEEGNESSAPKEHIADDDQQTTEVAASREDLTDELQASNPLPDTQIMIQSDVVVSQDAPTDEVAIIPESPEDEPLDEDDDEDPITKPRRTTRHSERKQADQGAQEAPGDNGGRLKRHALRSARETRKIRTTQKNGRQESSDFEPVGEEEEAEGDISDSEVSESSPRKGSQQVDEDSSTHGRIGTRAGKGRSRSQRNQPSEDSEVAEELAEELEDLRGSRPRRAPRADILFDDKPKTRKRKPVDYRILRPDLAIPLEDDGPPTATTPSRRGRGGAGGTWQRSLFSTYGPFGGAGGPTPVFGGPGGIGAAAGADSDSSDDDIAQRPRNVGIGGTLGMTPTAAAPAGFGMFPAAQAHGSDPLQGPSGTPANLGKIKDKHALADADPLGIDQNVNFDSVGGLQGHIDQLKEMVALPLLYPEVFQRFHVTPPRGVLFHGPPGTGKTLLARALASSVSTQGRKVTFYMRKGADALSKWVGEAERQLRLLFDEARKTQPSIIFFDEIDGWCFYVHEIPPSLRSLRPCTRAIEQAGTDTCLDCLDSSGFNGWDGRSRSSDCDRSHQPT